MHAHIWSNQMELNLTRVWLITSWFEKLDHFVPTLKVELVVTNDNGFNGGITSSKDG